MRAVIVETGALPPSKAREGPGTIIAPNVSATCYGGGGDARRRRRQKNPTAEGRTPGHKEISKRTLRERKRGARTLGFHGKTRVRSWLLEHDPPSWSAVFQARGEPVGSLKGLAG